MTDLKILNACIPDYDNDNFVMGDILINDGKIVKISACGEIEEETEVAKWKCTTTRIELGNIDRNETDVYTSTSNLIFDTSIDYLIVPSDFFVNKIEKYIEFLNNNNDVNFPFFLKK